MNFDKNILREVNKVGRIDDVAKKVFERNEVIEDLVRLYYGEENIQIDKCVEIDTEIGNKRRDILKECFINEEKVFIGIELQTVMDPTMPLRVMEYDVEVMKKQISKKRRENEKNGIRNQLKDGEFISGIRKEDKINRVITIVVYLSGKKWEGARSLVAMTHGTDWDGYDVHLRIMEPVKLQEEKLWKCQSEIGKVLAVLKYSQSEEKLIECISKEEYQSVDREIAELINVLIDMKIEIKEKEGKVDMCKAIEDLRIHCKEEGILIGKKEGIIQGEKSEKINTAKRMMESGMFTLEMISVAVGLPIASIQKLQG